MSDLEGDIIPMDIDWPAAAAASADDAAAADAALPLVRQISERGHGFMRQNSSDAIQVQRPDGSFSALASRCNQDIGEFRPINDDVPTYIIVAHGIYLGPHSTVPWSQTEVGINLQKTAGKNPADTVIAEPLKYWDGISFGVLVQENTSLGSLYKGIGHDGISGIQKQAIEHINEIVSGKIKVFQRYPWKQRNNSNIGMFPQLIFGGGGRYDIHGNLLVDKSFIDTIVRIDRRGDIRFAGLSPSIHSSNPHLAWFSHRDGRGKYYPGSIPTHLLKHKYHQHTHLATVKLSDLINKLKINSEYLRKRGGGRRGFNVVFATCLQGLPRRTHEYWIGRNKERRILPNIVSSRGASARASPGESKQATKESAKKKGSKGGRKKKTRRRRKKKKFSKSSRRKKRKSRRRKKTRKYK